MLQPAQRDDAVFTPQFHLDVLLRRRWIVLAGVGICLALGGFRLLTRVPVYRAAAMLVIERERSGGGGARSQYAAGLTVDIGAPDYYQTQYELMKSRSLLETVCARTAQAKIEAFSGPGCPDDVAASISIVPKERSRLVQVVGRSTDPKLAALLANMLAESFVEQNLGNQLFISKEILRVLQASPDDPESRKLYESLPAVVSNQLIQSLKGNYSRLRSEWAEKSQQLTPRHPAMTALKSQMDSVKDQIAVETDRVVSSLKAELSGQLQGNNVRIVDRAIPPTRPSWADWRKVLMLCLLAGLVLGYVLALLIEAVDQTVRTEDDVEKNLALPFLGILPLVRFPERVFRNAGASERSMTGEAFRNLRTMVEFSLVNEKHRVVLVTSSVPEEGKTYISTNLAAAFSEIGLSVLLIGGDLRRPRLHRLLEISSEKGLSDFLATGKSVDELDALIVPSDYPKLKVLGSGRPPPNPAELLNTPRLGAMVSWAQSRFDRVVVDATPLFPISDTLLWGQHVPRAIFVVRSGRTRTPLIRSACQQLGKADIKILGVAVNAAKLSGFAYSHYRYGYAKYYHDYQATPTHAS